jgi:uncharacterized protein YigE (DUF2233 family)
LSQLTKALADGNKIGVSLIPDGPRPIATHKQPLTLLFSQNSSKYRDVTRAQLGALIHYHTTVIAPRHQQLRQHQLDPAARHYRTFPRLN